MKKSDWRYARVLRGGIMHVIRETARAGFRVDAVRVNKHDRKLLRNANPTRSYMIAGVPIEVDDEGKFEPYSKQFTLITNAPKGGREMAEGLRGIEFEDGAEWPEPEDDS